MLISYHLCFSDIPLQAFCLHHGCKPFVYTKVAIVSFFNFLDFTGSTTLEAIIFKVTWRNKAVT